MRSVPAWHECHAWAQQNGRRISAAFVQKHADSTAAKAAGGLAQLEGDYEGYGMVIATDEDSTAKRFYDKLKSQYKLTVPWNVMTVQGIAQALVSLRAIEHAVKKNGAANLTGAKVRDALFAEPVTTEETFTMLPTLKFSKEAPFPVEGLKVNVGTVKNGKYVTVATGVDIPPVKKW